MENKELNRKIAEVIETYKNLEVLIPSATFEQELIEKYVVKRMHSQSRLKISVATTICLLLITVNIAFVIISTTYSKTNTEKNRSRDLETLSNELLF